MGLWKGSAKIDRRSYMRGRVKVSLTVVTQPEEGVTVACTVD